MSKRILLIDDEASLLKLVSTELTKLGYEVLQAHDGIEGVTMVHDALPDLVILDIMLPKKDGYQVLKEIKDDERTSQIPVIMLTGLGLDEEIEKGINLGVTHYLVKPLKMKLLIKCISANLRN